MSSHRLFFHQAQTVDPKAYDELVSQMKKKCLDIEAYNLSFSLETWVWCGPGKMKMDDSSIPLQTRIDDWMKRVGCSLKGKYGRKSHSVKLSTVPQILIDEQIALMKEKDTNPPIIKPLEIILIPKNVKKKKR